MQEPVEYQVARRKVFGLAPSGLLAALALATLVAAVLLLAAGSTLAGVLFLFAGLLLGSLWLDQTGRRHGRLRDVASLASGTLGAWASAGPELARVRLDAARLTKERAQALYAHEQGDESAAARLEQLDAQMEECVERANEVLRRTRKRVSGEQLAAARTMIVPPED